MNYQQHNHIIIKLFAYSLQDSICKILMDYSKFHITLFCLQAGVNASNIIATDKIINHAWKHGTMDTVLARVINSG